MLKDFRPYAEAQKKVEEAGLEVLEARITYLAYAPEIAAVMLQRQQASAIIDARKMIVDGAVGMVEMALNKLSEKNVVELDDERKAREIAETRKHIRFNEEMGVGKGVSLNELLKNQTNEEVKVLNLIIKCDVQGSIEAIKGLLDKINIEGTKINVISSRVGGITETDINPVVMNGYSIETKNHDFFSTKGNGYVVATNVDKLTDDVFYFGDM